MAFLQKHKTLLLIFLGGLVLRLLVMPFSMHADLLSMYFRAHLMAEHGFWQLPSGQYLGHLVYAVNLLLMKAGGWDIAGLFPLPFGLTPGSMTASVGNWLVFQDIPGIQQALFWWKLPHLLADTAVFGLLMSAFSRSKRRNFVLAAWWLNPVNIYAFYIFARHDALTALAVAGVLLFTARKKLLPAMLSLWAAIEVRTQPLIYVPLFLLAWWKGFRWQELLKNGLMTVIIVGAYFFLRGLLPENQLAYEQATGALEARASSATFTLPGGRFRAETLESIFGGLPLFPIASVVLGVSLWLFSQVKKSSQGLELVNAWFLVLMSLYFALNAFSPHYFVWLSIFWVIGFGFQKKLLWPYLGAVVGWLIMGAMATDAFSINQNLFLPLAPSLFRTPQLPVLLASRGIDPGALFLIGRVVLSGSLAVLAWQTWQTSIRPTLRAPRKWTSLLKPGVWLSVLLAVLLLRPTSAQALTAPVFEVSSGQELLLLAPGKPYKATFTSPADQFGALEIQLASDRIPSGQNLVFRLKEAGEDAWLYEGRLNRDDIYDFAFYPVGFPPVIQAQGKGFVWELELTEGENPESWTALVGGKDEANFRLLADDTEAFKNQTRERLSQEYARSPLFWQGYVAVLGLLCAAFIAQLLAILRNIM